MRITIRPATLADADELAVMNKQLIEDEKHDNPMTIPQLKERMTGFLSGEYMALLCFDDNNTIGYALINKTAEPIYLRQFFICRDKRRKGYGKHFFNKLLEYINTDKIDIEVMVWNEAGKAFWESLKFKPRSIYMRYGGERMPTQNPWRQLSHDTYEKHMGHEDVRQLETLSCIFGEQLTLVADMQKPVIAVLGITGGNGLGNVQAGRCKTVIGMDINSEYLDICRKRYNHLPELELHQIDLMTEKDRAVNVLKQADLITANLLVKHIHLGNFMDIVSRLERPVISVTIQFNPDGQIISHSGYEAEFVEIVRHGELHDEAALTDAMINAGYNATGRKEYILPNEKIFIRLDYKRRRIA